MDDPARELAKIVIEYHVKGFEGPLYYSPEACAAGCGNWPCDAYKIANEILRREDDRHT